MEELLETSGIGGSVGRERNSLCLGVVYDWVECEFADILYTDELCAKDELLADARVELVASCAEHLIEDTRLLRWHFGR